ncbi:hypothetical protein [Mesorhizobium cantuariense]|uniref:Uncharacterized protein n=1 Tax=Mesorhizobium cantuariense TaxID=1300275 RepID=A0ABV7MYB8_9HYPH
MNLLLTVPGATSEEISRGIAAAEAALENAGFTAEEAADGFFAMEGWDSADPDDDLTGDEGDAAQAWSDAYTAARNACCAGWPEARMPTNMSLDLLIDPETQLADRATALRMLRDYVDDDARKEVFDGNDAILAWRVAADFESIKMRDLVSDVTVAFTRLKHAHFHPEEPIEPKRLAVLAAIDAIEAATEKQTSH